MPTVLMLAGLRGEGPGRLQFTLPSPPTLQRLLAVLVEEGALQPEQIVEEMAAILDGVVIPREHWGSALVDGESEVVLFPPLEGG